MVDAFPLDLPRESEELESVFTNLVDRSQGGQRNAKKGNRHYWRMRLVTPKLQPAIYRRFFGFGVKQEGRYQVFTVNSSILNLPQGVATGTPLVNGAHSAGAYSVTIDGLTNSIVGILKQGDLIQFSGHRKVYMVTADVTSSGSGVGIVPIMPALVASLADNETVVLNNVQFYMAFAKDPLPLTTDVNKYASFDIELEEVWNE